MPKNPYLYLALWIWFTLPVTTSGQIPTPTPFKTLSVADGLPQSFISGLVQDQQGFIWIGTRDGLARYDGRTFKLFNHVQGDSTTLAANVITNLYYGASNRLWILYESGDIDILQTDTEILTHVSKLPGANLITNQLKGHFSIAQAIAEDSAGHTWLLNKDSGLYIYDHQRRILQFYSNASLGLHHNPVTGITRAGNNMLLVTDTALVTMNTNRQIVATVPFTFERPHLYHARRPWKDTRPFIRRNGDVVILDEDRVILYQPAQHRFTAWPLPERSMYSGPCVTIDDKDNIYFDHAGIIYLLQSDNQLFTWQTPRSVLYPNSITMLFDRSGVLWIGGNGSGVALYDMRLQHINGSMYKTDFFSDVLHLYDRVPASDIAATVLYKANQYTIRHVTGKDGTNWFTQSGADTAYTSRVFYAHRGYMRAMQFAYAAGNKELHTGIPALAFSKAGVLWGIDSRFHPVRFDTATRSVRVYPSLYPTGGFNDLLIDGEFTFWITSVSKGLFRYELTTGKLLHFQQTDQPGQLPSAQLLDLENDPNDENILWMSSMGGGLVRLDKTTRRCRSFTMQDGLPNNTVYTIVPDSRGLFWCSSNKGIFTFDPRTHEVRSFTTKDGLLNDEFNRFHFLKLPDGRLAFGGVDSYTVLDPLAITEDDFQPQVVLTGLSINNEAADYGQPGSHIDQSLNSLSAISLPWHHNFLTFRFAALEYNIPDKLQYRYRLVGIDQKWVYANTNNTATYTNVPPGQYELQINATNTSGAWSPHIKSIILLITPPFWKTWWFIALVIFISTLLVFLLIRNRVKNLHKKEKQQLQFDREVMELEAQALRAQMNPHFIFNCLNSIKVLIQEDKKQEAVTYLTTFSKLIRNQLNNSQKEISLADELKTCRLYLQMEALRFGAGMTYAFHIDEAVDVYSLMIPPLIIQPFIENAIWHGILPRETGGKVTIAVIDKGNRVECIVDDDGIGYEQSLQNRSGNGTHDPKGMQLTRTRLHLYNLMHQRGGHISRTDKKDSNGQATGTTVTITFKKEV